MKAATLLPESPVTPRKLFYRIQEVATMTGLKPYVLRYWESEFKELAPAKDASDQRRYRQTDVDVIQAIRKLLYEERYTIKGARSRLRDELKKMRGHHPTETVASESLASSLPARTSSDSRKQQLDRSLRRLRMEVNELINMLSA